MGKLKHEFTDGESREVIQAVTTAFGPGLDPIWIGGNHERKYLEVQVQFPDTLERRWELNWLVMLQAVKQLYPTYEVKIVRKGV